MLSTVQIGAICGVVESTIRKWLKKYNIIRRSSGEANHLRQGNHCNLSDRAMQWIEGELLGDGCLYSKSKYSAQFTYSSKYNEYINYISNTLLKFGIRRTGKIYFRENIHYKINNIPTHSKESYSYTSKRYAELKPLYDKWYPEGKKIVPRDIELTSILLRQWYIGDGSLKIGKGARSRIKLSTQCFTINDVEWLIEQLNKLGFKSTRQSRNTIRISAYSTKDFLNYIGNSPVKCYQYKWSGYNKGFTKIYKEELRAYNKQYQQEHKEEIKVKDRQYHKDHKEKRNAMSRKYHKDHREELNAYNRIYGKKYRKEHREKLKIKARRYYQEHKEEINTRHRQRYRDNKLNKLRGINE